MTNKNSVTIRTGPLFLLFLVFLILKLTGHIDWSWWYVTMPLWGPFVFFFTLWIAIVVLFGLFYIITAPFK